MTGQIWAWITGGIARLVLALTGGTKGFIGKGLSTLGLSVVTYESILPNLKTFVTQQIAVLPPDALNFLGALGIGQAMSMILSALTVRMAWRVWIVPKPAADSMGGGT